MTRGCNHHARIHFPNIQGDKSTPSTFNSQISDWWAFQQQILESLPLVLLVFTIWLHPWYWHAVYGNLKFFQLSGNIALLSDTFHAIWFKTFADDILVSGRPIACWISYDTLEPKGLGYMQKKGAKAATGAIHFQKVLLCRLFSLLLPQLQFCTPLSVARGKEIAHCSWVNFSDVTSSYTLSVDA